MLPQSMSVAQIRRPKITFDSILDSLGLCHFESKMEFEHIPGSIIINRKGADIPHIKAQAKTGHVTTARAHVTHDCHWSQEQSNKCWNLITCFIIIIKKLHLYEK